jgi:hypothetical protein
MVVERGLDLGDCGRGAGFREHEKNMQEGHSI